MRNPVPADQTPSVIFWDRKAPNDAPFLTSKTFAGVRSTGSMATYTAADIWYPSWASDGNLYSSFTDGHVHGCLVASVGDEAATGHARISGRNPWISRLTRLDRILNPPARTQDETLAGRWFTKEFDITALIA